MLAAHPTSAKPKTLRLLAAATLACALGVSTGCGEDRVTYTPAHGSHMSGNESEESSGAADFSHKDIMFAEMMIPHHEQAITMSDLALRNSTDARVRALAVRIKTAQAPEIALMKSWVEESGMAGMHGPADHTMAGMLSEAEIEEMQSATGRAFDTLFLTGMIAHHQGAVDMAKAVAASGNAAVAKLAASIISSQTAEIAEMKALLSELR